MSISSRWLGGLVELAGMDQGGGPIFSARGADRPQIRARDAELSGPTAAFHSVSSQGGLNLAGQGTYGHGAGRS